MSEKTKKRHKISVLVRNKFGVLTRVAAMFSGRGYNIDSLSVATSQSKETSVMTIVTHGDDDTIEQIEKQLTKLIDVIHVTAFNGQNFVDRELMLVKVKANGFHRAEVIQISDIFGAQVVSVHEGTIIVQITGDSEKLNQFIKLMQGFGIIEVSRSGPIGMMRSDLPTQSF